MSSTGHAEWSELPCFALSSAMQCIVWNVVKLEWQRSSSSTWSKYNQPGWALHLAPFCGHLKCHWSWSSRVPNRCVAFSNVSLHWTGFHFSGTIHSLKPYNLRPFFINLSVIQVLSNICVGRVGKRPSWLCWRARQRSPGRCVCSGEACVLSMLAAMCPPI